MALAASSLSLAAAQAELLLDAVSPHNGIGYVASGGATIGYGFSLSNGISVAALGLWDLNSDGLASSHQVGLWNGSGTLLASTTVTNSSVIVASAHTEGRWLFENISAVALTPGQYYMGFLQPAENNGQDLVIRDNVVMMAGAIKGAGTFGGFNNPNTLTFPNNNSNGDGFFGPNLSTTTVPEPTAALLLLGSGAMLLLRRPRAAAR